MAEELERGGWVRDALTETLWEFDYVDGWEDSLSLGRYLTKIDTGFQEQIKFRTRGEI